MSQINTNAILDASGGTTTSINGYTPTVSNMAGRNRIINGDFLVAQRGTSFAGVVMSGADAPYNLDRWQTNRANVGDTGACTISQVTGGGIRYEVTTTDAVLTAGSATSLRQLIEGYNCVGLAGNALTVSFKMKTNKLGTYGVWLYDYTASAYKTSSINVTSSGTIETYSITFDSIPSITIDNSARIALNITLTAQSSREGAWYPSGETQVNLFDTVGNYVEVYDVQLEAGSVATPFEHRQYGQELALCQRYYQKYLIGSYIRYAIGYADTSSRVYVAPQLPVTLRSTPSITQSSLTVEGNGLSSIGNIAGTSAMSFTLNHTGTFSSGETWQVYSISANGYIDFSAEL